MLGPIKLGEISQGLWDPGLKKVNFPNCLPPNKGTGLVSLNGTKDYNQNPDKNVGGPFGANFRKGNTLKIHTLPL